MAMTLRTNDADDQLLDKLAAHYGVSKQQAALTAIRDHAHEVFGLAEVDELADRALIEWGPVFDALRDS